MHIPAHKNVARPAGQIVNSIEPVHQVKAPVDFYCWITIAEAAEQRGLNERWLQRACKARRVPGARLIGRLWMLPDDFTVIPGKRGPKTAESATTA